MTSNFYKLEMNSNHREALDIAMLKRGKSSMPNILSVVPRNEKEKGREEITLPREVNNTFLPLYFDHHSDNPMRYYITGASLTGKSTWASFIINSYKKKYPNHKVYLFSGVGSDPALDKYHVTRIDISDDLVSEEIELNEIKNSLTIFDDIDTLPKEQSKALNKLRDKCFNAGRHQNIAVVSVAQVACEGSKTKSVILNSFMVVMFPVGGMSQIVYFLERYMCMKNKDLINKIRGLRTRWIAIHRVPPMYILFEGGCWLL